MVQILIIDDHPLFRMALQQTMAKIPAIDRIVEASSLAEGQATLAATGEIAMVLLDLFLPDNCGYGGLVMLRNSYPSLPIVIVSASEDPAIIQLTLAYGALGYIPKSLSLPEIARAIEAILEGDTWIPPAAAGRFTPMDEQKTGVIQKLSSLTAAQIRVMIAISKGLLNKEIAYEMGISEATVKTHISHVLKKLDLNTRTQVALLAQTLQVDLLRIDRVQ